jgi:hypothetical protein
MTLDQNTISSIKKQVPQAARTQIQKQFGAAFQKLKNKMMVEFLNHPVTMELKAGVNSSNISGTLGGGSGNLFSFIGFDGGSDPTKPIEDMLSQTTFKFLRVTNKSVEFAIDLPDAKEIFSVTPMPWAPGRSWARGIERGISGLGYYLKIKTDNSRSGLGIQSSRKVRKSSSKFKNMQYISALLKKYKKEFENLQLP